MASRNVVQNYQFDEILKGEESTLAYYSDDGNALTDSDSDNITPDRDCSNDFGNTHIMEPYQYQPGDT